MTLLNVRHAARDLADARQRVARAEETLRRFIRHAVQQGESVAAIAEAAGISRARVYQIRDGRR